jgi:hypothetical protein
MKRSYLTYEFRWPALGKVMVPVISNVNVQCTMYLDHAERKYRCIP